MSHINLPQLKRTLKEDLTDNKKYKLIGERIYIDIRPPTENINNFNDIELQNFYKNSLHKLLLNNKEKQSITVIVTKQNTNPHCYADPLFQLLATNSELWPHGPKI